MIKKLITILTSTVGLLSLAVVPALAHVIVTPHQVGVAVTQDFTITVPNEKDTPVIAVRLLIPDGVTSVIPNIVPGWTIDSKSNGDGDNAEVTEIDWSGGSIPAGQRAEFVFNAQVPAKSTTLAWKAYQTYFDGTEVSWDINPVTMKNVPDEEQDKMADQENKGVYSTTTVINDLTGSSSSTSQPASTLAADLTSKIKSLELFTGIAFALSAVALALTLRKRD